MIERKKFHANLRRRCQPRLAITRNGGIKRPVGVFLAGYHRQNSVAGRFVKMPLVRQDECRPAFMCLSVRKWERNDDDIIWFISHGMLLRHFRKAIQRQAFLPGPE